MIMTRETFNTASSILADIGFLKDIKAEYTNRRDITSCGGLINNKKVRDGLKTFIDDEIAKLEEEFEKL